VHPLVLVALMLVFVAGPVLFVAAMVADSMLLLCVGLGAVGLGLMLAVSALVSGRNTQGTKLWQNDGLPGGG
jgi:hypothetical protein